MYPDSPNPDPDYTPATRQPRSTEDLFAPEEEQQRGVPLVAQFDEQPILTYLLIGLLVLVHFFLTAQGGIGRLQAYADYANVSELVTQGEYYRLFTSMFLHADLTHLLFNCLGLFIFGKEVERLFGHFRFGVVYLGGGLVGSVASYWITSGSSIGASGAVFAVFGAFGAYIYRHRKLYGEAANRQIRSLLVLAAVNLGIGFLSNAPGSPVRIDNAAHVGGALGGLALALALGPRYQVRMEVNPGRHLASAPH
ncbi:MAG: rhomboid family intramembrane serine protease [Anaerolineae bacterium]|nr:rhomboid family intramembrane serine protease [Anaerolineae bacterium]